MKAETKFNLGDRVTFLNPQTMKVAQAPITQVSVITDMKGWSDFSPENQKTRVEYYLNIGGDKKYDCLIITEDKCYETREELLQSI